MTKRTDVDVVIATGNTYRHVTPPKSAKASTNIGDEFAEPDYLEVEAEERYCNF